MNWKNGMGNNIGVLVLAIVIGGVALVSLGQSHAASYPPPETPPTFDRNRPAREWWVYWRNDDGVRVRKLYEVTTADEAIKAFRDDMGPNVMVTCMEQPHYDLCVERVWW